MTNVGFVRSNKANEDERFVIRRFLASTIVQFNKMMLQRPFTTHRAFNDATIADFAFDLTIADKIVEKRILKQRRSQRLSERNSEQQGGNQQIYRCFHQL